MIESCLASQPPGLRSHNDLVNILPWFRKYGRSILKGAPNEVLIEILQKCTYEVYERDTMIISQGEFGDSFFILLEGQVSIYVRDLDSSGDDTRKRQGSLFANDTRGSLGTRVLVEGEGYSFGEYALLDEKGVRRASVVADEVCAIISIDSDTYNSCLKELQKGLLMDCEAFINSNLLFKDFSLNLKDIIKMSLKRISFPYNTKVILQGQKYSGLIFILSGSCHLSIDGSKHEIQYPNMFPLDFAVYEQRYKEFPELKPTLHTKDRTEEECVEGLNPKVIRLKRARNYAALERYLVNQNRHVCSMQCGEIIGDLELLFDLETNLYSVTSSEETEVYILETVHIDRLFKRMDPSTLLDRLKTVIRPKLRYRAKYFSEIPVPLMIFLTEKLYDKKFHSMKEFPKMKTEKVLPTDEELWQHLLQMYAKDKAPNFLPYTRNSVFLRDLMKLNATRRQKQKGRQIPDDEIGITLTGNRIGSFPLDQEVIYKLQKVATDSVNFIELVFKEVHRQSMKNQKMLYSLQTRNVSKISFREPSMVGKLDTERLQTNLTERSMWSEIQRGKEKSDKTKGSHKQSHLSRKDLVSNLQKSEIQFLNTLCSEKSRYKIKADNSGHSDVEGIRTHFLPILPNTAEIMQRNFKRKAVQTRR